MTSWTFTPSKDWNGEVEFSYSVTESVSKENKGNNDVNENLFIRDNKLHKVLRLVNRGRFEK